MTEEVKEEEFFTAQELLEGAQSEIVTEITHLGKTKKIKLRKPSWEEIMMINRGTKGNDELATIKLISLCCIQPQLTEDMIRKLDTSVILQLSTKIADLTAGSPEVQERLKNLQGLSSAGQSG